MIQNSQYSFHNLYLLISSELTEHNSNKKNAMDVIIYELHFNEHELFVMFNKKVRFFIFWTFSHTFIKGNLECLSNRYKLRFKNKLYHG